MISLIMIKAGGKIIIRTVVLGFLIVSCTSSDCDVMKQLQTCAEPMSHLQNVIISSTFKTVSEMLQECEIQLQGVSCIKNISKCMPKEERDVLELTTAGTQQVIEELCNNTSEMHKRYMDSFDCIQEVTKEGKHCDEKFDVSQRKIQEEVHSERIKRFYSCCSFEWLTQCKVGIAERLCNLETTTLVDHMVRTLHVKATSRLCENDVFSCYDRLYGFDHGVQLEYSKLAAWMLLVCVLYVDYLYRN